MSIVGCERNLEFVYERPLRHLHGHRDALEMIARQASRVVLARTQNIDAVVRLTVRRRLVGTFGRSLRLLVMAAAISTATSLILIERLLDDRIADAERLLRPTARIEPDGQAEPCDLAPHVR